MSYWCSIFPVSVFAEFSVLSIAVRNFVGNLLSMIFVVLFFYNFKRISKQKTPANKILPIVSFNVFIQAMPGNCVIPVLSHLNVSIFCFLFYFSMFTGMFHRNSYLDFNFCILTDFIIFFYGGIIDIGDPVSIINSFITPLIFTTAV